MSISASREFVVRASVDDVWRVTEDLGNLALCMPGYKSHTIIDPSHSLWVLGVELGAFTKTLDFDVTIMETVPRERLGFEFKATNEPVSGDGTFSLDASTEGSVHVSITLSVRGSGPMAKMFEAMSRPVMPVLTDKFTKKFAEEVSHFNSRAE